MAIYIGIDLGTTNSAIACFDGDTLQLIPNSRGEASTPSVVRVTETGFLVGRKAQKLLASDPLHTHKEFKRLMGTAATTRVDSFGRQYRPQELAAELLKALREDAHRHYGTTPQVAVITVPALFELPQSNATAEAARLAGFRNVDLIPEPVASALAAGWSDEDVGKPWLVFDLGGGTFDVSLVESRDGLLRVVGHDGDNFLGGRDIDRRLADWVLERLASEQGAVINQGDDAYETALRHIHQEVEHAKVRLSELERTAVELDFAVGDREIEADLMLSRAELEELAAPVIDRAIEICQRLLAQHGLSSDQLGRVVLVGGPAHMPMVKARVREQLAPLAAENEDPMSLVAKGAALYAATIGLENAASVDAPEPATEACQLWLQYPTVSADLMPEVMGRVVEDQGSPPHRIRFSRDDDLWESNDLSPDEHGVFESPLQLLGARSNRFRISIYDQAGLELPCMPATITIVHGLTLADPPLSRSVGVALADGHKRNFIERGTPLPAKRTFTQHTAETLVPGTNQRLNIPIIQGEREQARFCRKVGNLVIESSELERQLPAGSEIEITIEIDRGANLKASALVVEQHKLIHGVAELLMPSADPAVLRAGYTQLQARLAEQQREAFARKSEGAIKALDRLSGSLQTVGRDLQKAEGDQDVCLRVQRNLMEVEAEIETLETQDQIEELMAECQSAYLNASTAVEAWGNEVEKKLLADCQPRLIKAFEMKRIAELERLIEQMNNINSSAYRRSPRFWRDQFEYSASRAHEASSLRKANKLVEKGRALIESGRAEGLESIVQQLWSLLPVDRQRAGYSHESGIH